MNFAQLIERLQNIEFSDSPSKLKDLIRYTLPRLYETLALIFNSLDDQARNHWKGEVVGFISEYNGLKLKRSHKYPLAKTYYDALWKDTVYADSPKKLDSLLRKKFKKEQLEFPTEEKINQIKIMMSDFLLKLSEEMSKGFVDDDEVYSLIDEVQFKNSSI